MKIADLAKPRLEQLNPDGFVIDPAKASPFPPLELIGEKLTSPIRPGVPDLIEGFMPKRGQLVIAGETNVGKAQPLNALVLTPTGWAQMGNLRLGDSIINPHGGTSTIVGVYPQGLKQVYRVTLTDGRSTEACAEHLWEVYHPNWARLESGYKVLSTQQLTELTPKYRKRVCVDTPTETNFGVLAALPIDPWLLGMLLGDGTISQAGVQFTTSDPELAVKASSVLPSGLEVRKLSAKYQYSIVQIGGCHRKGHCGVTPNSLKEALIDLDLMGTKSYQKFIPQIYLGSPRNIRVGLLQGLLDTDGYVAPHGFLEYTSTSQQLAEDVQYLVRSLGGYARIRTKKTGYRSKLTGEFIPCRLAYNVHIAFKEPKEFITLSRRRVRLQEIRNPRLLKIKSIEPTRITETQCIRVDNSGGLYVTNDFIVTHNTTIALEIVSCLTTGAPLWKEKKPTEVIGRVLYVLGEHYNDIVKGLWHRMGVPMGDDVWILGPEQLTVDKWLVQSGKQNPVAISKLIKWAEGADLIVFDPLSAFLTGSDAENDNIQMRLVLDSMSLIAQSVNASCLVLAHQGKPAVGKDGQEYARTKYAIRGASAIEDAATNIFYMSRVMGASTVAETRDSKVFEMRNRKYKGDAPEKYELVKDPHNLTHTLLGNRPYIQVRQMETQSTYARFSISFPEASKSDLLKMVECATGLSEASIRRALEMKDERGK